MSVRCILIAAVLLAAAAPAQELLDQLAGLLNRGKLNLEVRNSIGIMLVSGMIIGTCFTLFVVPSIYVLLALTHRREQVRELEVEPELEPAAV